MKITILTQQAVNGEVETNEVTVPAEKKKIDGKTVIFYREPEENGLGSVLTAYKTDGKALTVSRTGDITMVMRFVEGKTTYSQYRFPYGTFSLAVTTKRLEIDIEERFIIEYTVCIDGKETIDHLMCITMNE